MGVSAPAASNANGLSTVLNVITAPREAFETLRPSPMWGWAFLVATVLTAIGQYLAMPATIHAMQASWPAQVASNPQLAGAPPAAQQNALNISIAVVRWSWVWSPIVVLVGALVAAIIMVVFNALARGDAGFKQLWCAAMNVAVVSAGVSSLIMGLIAVVRGAASYETTRDAYKAIPSLAWLAPQAGLKLSAFLAGINAVSVWATVLIAMAMIHVARTSRGAAAACGLVMLAIGAGFLSLSAR